MGGAALPELSWIYDKYHAKVVAYAAKMIGRDDAEDVAQEVFIKVGRALPTLAAPSRLTSWIFAIAANTVKDVARARAARSARLPGLPATSNEGADPLDSIPDGAARSAEEVAARNEMVACYLGVVERLSANYYDVYALSELEGFTYAEIGRRLSISVGAAFPSRWAPLRSGFTAPAPGFSASCVATASRTTTSAAS